MKIEAGKFYRKRNGAVVGPMSVSQRGIKDFGVPGTTWYSDGRHCNDECQSDIISEVIVTDVLPFELKAGSKYCTVKPDGTAGPVVELRFSKDDEIGVSRNSPFPLRVVGSFNYVSGGSCFCSLSGTLLYQITAPYVEPPPTIAERLGELKTELGATVAAKLDAIIADLKAEASK